MARLYYGSVMSDGARIQYYRTGEDKPPIVMLHGMTDNGLCWNRTALMLEPDFDVVMIDARGHGLSEAPESGYDYHQQARDAAAVIEALELAPTTVLGHSMGAQAAALLAVEFPHLVSSLILEDPPWEAADQSPEEREASRQQLLSNIATFQSKSEAELIEVCRLLYPRWEAGDVQTWARAKRQVKIEAARLREHPRPRWQDFVAGIRCPVLLFTGDTAKGGMTPPEVAAQVARSIKKCYVVHVPEAGHNIRRDQFDPFFDAVSTFLAI